MINRIFFIFMGIAFIGYIFTKVKKGKLEEKESIFWMIGACGILILSFFPGIIVNLAKLLHIEYAPSLLFFIGILFTLIIAFRISMYVSILKEQVKELGQRNAVLENKIAIMEKKQ